MEKKEINQVLVKIEICGAIVHSDSEVVDVHYCNFLYHVALMRNEESVMYLPSCADSKVN